MRNAAEIDHGLIISNPKFRNLKLDFVQRCLDGGRDDPAEFLIFRDNSNHFVARKQTIRDDLVQPGLGLVRSLSTDLKLVNEVGTAFGGSISSPFSRATQ